MPEATPPPNGFADRLYDAIHRCGIPGCIGLDPVLEKLPASVRSADPVGAIGTFCEGIISVAASCVPAVKFQSACFERYGALGIALLARLIGLAREAGLLVILDAKRGDIGITNEHYAAAIAGAGADAVTLSGYLGMGVVDPFLKAGLGVFVLVRTSNPDGDEIQSQRLANGRTVAEMMAGEVATLGRRWTGRHGYSDVGAVVGATKAADGRELRRHMPHQFFLVPGYGAQGGTLEDVRSLVDQRGGGVIVTASRSVIYAFGGSGGDWIAGVGAAARAFADEIRPLVD